MIYRRVTLLPALAAALLLAGCASGASEAPPTAQIAVARTQLADAEQAGALQYAPVPYNRARDRLARAEAAARQEDYVQAARLASEAEADARLANVATQAAHAEQAAAAVQKGTTVLRDQAAPAGEQAPSGEQ